MTRLTNREYLTWLAWLEAEQNEPKVSDFYLMQIAAEVRRVLSKHPRDITLDQFKLKFARKEDTAPKTPMTIQEASDLAKARWFGVLGMVRKKEENGRD